ncbi:MAG TPA: hypothetical protein VH396_20190 [Chitinophagaceae bacterium]|jgi:uncharacterized membrane protein
MEKRIFGIILTILGIVGLILAGVNFMNGNHGDNEGKMIAVYAILGIIFFFAGIGLLRNTRDKAT